MTELFLNYFGKVFAVPLYDLGAVKSFVRRRRAFARQAEIPRASVGTEPSGEITALIIIKPAASDANFFSPPSGSRSCENEISIITAPIEITYSLIHCAVKSPSLEYYKIEAIEIIIITPMQATEAKSMSMHSPVFRRTPVISESATGAENAAASL